MSRDAGLTRIRNPSSLAARAKENLLDSFLGLYSTPSPLTEGASGGVRQAERGRRRPRMCLASASPGGLGSPSAPTTWGCPCQGWTRTGRTAGKPAGIRWAKGPPSGPGSYGPEAQNRRGGAPEGDASSRLWARPPQPMAETTIVAPFGAPPPRGHPGPGDRGEPQERENSARECDPPAVCRAVDEHACPIAMARRHHGEDENDESEIQGEIQSQAAPRADQAAPRAHQASPRGK